MPHLRSFLHADISPIGWTGEYISARERQAVLKLWPTACMLLDVNGYLLNLNRPAEVLLGASDGICLRIGRVTPVDPWKRRPFWESLSSSQRGTPGQPHAALLLDRLSGKHALQLVITPMGTARNAECAGEILVSLIDPAQDHGLPENVLGQLYGLTTAESRIANFLLQGFSLLEISVARDVSVATVRSQMKTIFEKTGTNRQTELVRVLLTLARGLATPHGLCDLDQHLFSATTGERFRNTSSLTYQD